MAADKQITATLKTAFFLMTALFVLGCTNPFGMPEAGESSDRGSVAFSVDAGASGLGAQTIFPDFSMSQIESYRVTLTDGPASDVTQVVSDLEDGTFPADFEMNDIVPGSWNVRVEAFDEQDPDNAPGPLVRGVKNDVLIEAGARTNVGSIALRYLDDCEDVDCNPGFVDLTVTWPAEEDVDRVAFFIEDFDGGDVESLSDDRFTDENGRLKRTLDVAEDLDSDADTNDENRYVTSFFEDNTEIDAGWYWVSIRFERDGDPDDDEDRDTSAYMVHELVYVRPNVATAASIDIDDIPLEVRYAEEVEETVEEAVNDPDNDDFDVDDEFGFVFQGAGNTTLEVDVGDINDDIYLLFKVRNEYTGNNSPSDGSAADRFDKADVTVSTDANAEQEYIPPYTFVDDIEDLDDLPDMIPATDDEVVSITDLDDELTANDNLNGERVITEGDFLGFLQISYFVPADAQVVSLSFGGGTNTNYSFGDFEVELAE